MFDFFLDQNTLIILGGAFSNEDIDRHGVVGNPLNMTPSKAIFLSCVGNLPLTI